MRSLGSITATLTLLAIAGMSAAADRIATSDRRAAPSSGFRGEYDINDLRLTTGFLPKNNETDSSNFNWASNYRLAVTGMRSGGQFEDHGGLIYGGEFALNFATRTKNSVKVSENSQMFIGMVGWGYKLAPMPAIHFEGTPFLGIGLSEWEMTGQGHPVAFAYEYGLRGAAYYTFESMWQLGLDLRYQVHHAEPSFGNNSISFKTQGFAVLFSGGKRF
ncbi:MAG: hypothetical protein H0V44_18785 [Planctomycetes bacterium]|nr:hypothetical protein [Planctomycetota bacterium]